MKISTFVIAASLLTAMTGTSFAQDNKLPDNSASPAKEADKMKSGDKAGSAPNSSNPGTEAGADGNKTQDSRTTKTRDR